VPGIYMQFSVKDLSGLPHFFWNFDLGGLSVEILRLKKGRRLRAKKRMNPFLGKAHGK
jgi:hypothetical protein